MIVRDIMQTNVFTAQPDTDVRDLVQLMARHRISGVPVLDAGGNIAGVVSVTDVVALAAYGAEASRGGGWEDDEGQEDEESASYWRTMDAPLEFVMASATNVPAYSVEDIMTPAAFSVSPTTTITELARFLWRGRIHRALVVEDGALVGIVSAFDVLRAIAESPEPEEAVA